MKVYKVKAYTNAKRGSLDREITRLGHVRNYAVRMMSRYYRLFGKTLTNYSLSNHIARKKKIPCRTARMVAGLDAQSVQECLGRVYKGYRSFFSYCKRKRSGKTADRVRPPSTRKARHNKSFTLLQNGYKFNDDRSRLFIRGKWYGFFKSQEIKGKVKRLTVKRDRCGDIWFIVLTEWNDAADAPRTGKAAGYDFGLKTFLTRHDGEKVDTPLFLKKNMKKLARLQKALSRKVKWSNNRRKARIAVAKMHRRISDCRNDWQWKAAHEMVREFDVICLENLNIEGMKRMWGRKVSDCAFSEFVAKLEYLAWKNGKEVRKVDRWLASSQTCSVCGHRNAAVKDLKVREWTCPKCGTHHDRDVNAAKVIYMAGTSAIGRGSSKTPVSLAEIEA